MSREIVQWPPRPVFEVANCGLKASGRTALFFKSEIRIPKCEIQINHSRIRYATIRALRLWFARWVSDLLIADRRFLTTADCLLFGKDSSSI